MKGLFRSFIRPILEFQAKRFIRRHALRVVAVAGSVGKTSTRNVIAQVLAEKFRVYTHPSNYNDTISVPLAIFDLYTPGTIVNVFAWLVRLVQMEIKIWQKPSYNLVVLELGTDHPGEVLHFMKYLVPDVGVVTAVTPEHMEFFSSLDAVAAEELALAHGAKQMVISHDDIAPEFRRQHLPHELLVATFGLEKGSNYLGHISDADPLGGTKLRVTTPSSKHIDAQLHTYGEPIAKAAVAAVAVAELLELTHDQIKRGLEKITPVNGRMVVLEGVNGSVILDDSYNASPDAVIAALHALQSAPTDGRRIAILGSMNELGKDSARYHEEIGRAAVAVADILVTVGEMANRHIGPAALAAGFDERNYKPADSPVAAGEFLKLMVHSGDVILAKGSQNGVFTEEAVKVLLANPDDAQRLVRQSAHWMAVKRGQFPDVGYNS